MKRDLLLLKETIKAVFFSLIIILLSCNMVVGQKTEKNVPTLKERLFWGGSFSLQLGTFTDIEIAPVGGIWILPRFAIAAGPSYRFYKLHDIKTDIYGIRYYTQMVLLRNIDKIVPIGLNTSIFIHAEFESLSLETAFWKGYLPNHSPKRFTEDTFLGGGGISQQIGRRASVNFILLWALTDSEYQLYSNPEIRVSFIF